MGVYQREFVLQLGLYKTGLIIAQLNSMEKGNATCITRKELEEMWERRHQELMALPKEELVKMIIGTKADIGIIRG